jgi:two-component system KDP operon response regulator KdpE
MTRSFVTRCVAERPSSNAGGGGPSTGTIPAVRSRTALPGGQSLARIPSRTVLVVAPDRRAAETLAGDLADDGRAISVVANGAAAMHHVEAEQPDLIVIHLDLPDLDGVELCRLLRLWARCPIIAVSAREDERVVAALDNGADDFVVFPYDTAILQARIRVALRHSEAIAASLSGELIECGDVRLDVGAHQALVGDVAIDLQPRQFALLATLMRNAGQMVPHARLARALWGEHRSDADLERLRGAISTLRKLLGTGPRRPVIETATSLGYRLVPPS